MHLTPYGSYKSRHDFTQPQLMTCLVLRSYWKTTYRGVIEQLQVSGELRRAMGLRQLPNYSTLNKFAHRAGVLEVLDEMLSTLAEAAEEADGTACREAAMDATGLETSSANVPGVRAYERLGYTLCGVDRLYYGPYMPGETAIFLAKSL